MFVYKYIIYYTNSKLNKLYIMGHARATKTTAYKFINFVITI